MSSSGTRIVLGFFYKFKNSMNYYSSFITYNEEGEQRIDLWDIRYAIAVIAVEPAVKYSFV